MDTGSGLWNQFVPTAILSLGAMFKYGRTKSPSDKAFIERFFKTIADDIVLVFHASARRWGRFIELVIQSMAQAKASGKTELSNSDLADTFRRWTGAVDGGNVFLVETHIGSRLINFINPR